MLDFRTLFFVALALYGASVLVTIARPVLGRWPLVAGSAVHLLAMVLRGIEIHFFPLSNKMESFATAALAIALVAVATWRPSRAYGLVMLAALLAAMAGAATFPMEVTYPSPLLLTVWYPLHIPLSFLSYALWTGAAAAAVAFAVDRADAWVVQMERHALWGFGLWTAAMVCGGIWGVLAWGAYFLWDPKVLWSLILWFHFASFVHVRLTPSLRSRTWVRPVLAWLGLCWVLVAYVGTSFFFGDSSHAF